MASCDSNWRSEGHTFRGRSDTEVILAAVSQWGVQAGLRNFNGMFAFALWDRQEHQLHLVRDRLGEKPLYYGWMGTSFLFGSELKSLNAYPGFRATINRSALALYFRHNCVPAPHSIYEGIFKLPACNGSDSRLFERQSDSVFLDILDPAGSSHERASEPICWFRNRMPSENWKDV